MATNTIKATYMGERTLLNRLTGIARRDLPIPIASHPVFMSGRPTIEATHLKCWDDTPKISAHLEEHKPDIFFVDCTDQTSARGLLDRLSTMATNGTAFIGLSDIISEDGTGFFESFCSLKNHLSIPGISFGERRHSQLGGFLDVGALERIKAEGQAQLEIFSTVASAIDSVAGLRNMMFDTMLVDYGIYSGKYFSNELDIRLRSASRATVPTTVAVADLRNFKKVNDARGHLFGNRVIEKFADIFTKGRRPTDIVARPHASGDEFYFMFPEADESAVKVILDRILDAVKSEPFFKMDPTPAVNFGVFSFVLDKTSRMTLLELAKRFKHDAGNTNEEEMLAGLAVSVADELQYVSRYYRADELSSFTKEKGMNRYLIGNIDNAGFLHALFEQLSAHGKERDE